MTIGHSCKIFFWYLPNWTSTNLWCVFLYMYRNTHQMSVEVQFGRYQKNIWQEWSMVKNLSCAAWNVFPINSLSHSYSFIPHHKRNMNYNLKWNLVSMFELRYALCPQWDHLKIIYFQGHSCCELLITLGFLAEISFTPLSYHPWVQKLSKSSEKLLFFGILSEFVQFWLEKSGPNQLDELKWIILLLLKPKPSL